VTDNAREAGASHEVMCRFVRWLVPTLEGFPRSQRFLLGDRMRTAAGHAEAGSAAICLSLVPLLSEWATGRLLRFVRRYTPRGSAGREGLRLLPWRARRVNRAWSATRSSMRRAAARLLASQRHGQRSADLLHPDSIQ
jgi:hypothetical protein